MSTTYTINVRNLQQDPVTMWLFLAAPKYSTNPSQVFQNSTTFLQVPTYNPNSHQIFKASVQYLLEAGQQTVPVEIGNQIISNTTIDASLDTGYLANYSSQMGGFPSLSAGSTTVPPAADNMVVQTNTFTPVQSYYNSMTFGVQTSSGMTGVTWTPSPNIDYAITPTLTFYVAVGSYASNVLAEIDATSATNAVLKTGYGGSFNQFNNSWVTYEVDGTWQVQDKEWPHN